MSVLEIVEPFSVQNSAENEQPKIHSSKSTVRFKLHVKGGKLDCAESNEFEVHFVTWKVRACKKTGSRGVVLAVSLLSVFQGDTEAWTCEAEAAFELLPVAGGNSLENRFGYFNFSSVTPSQGFPEFVTWDDLTEKYLADDIATFDITITTKTPNRIPGFVRTSTKFNMRVKGLSKLGDQYSDEVIVRRIRWRVRAMKMGEYFAVFVYANENDLDIDFSWDVTVSFRLLTLGKEKQAPRIASNKPINWTKSSLGFSKFIKWSELFDPKKELVVNDATILQVELSVSKPKLN